MSKINVSVVVKPSKSAKKSKSRKTCKSRKPSKPVEVVDLFKKLSVVELIRSRIEAIYPGDDGRLLAVRASARLVSAILANPECSFKEFGTLFHNTLGEFFGW